MATTSRAATTRRSRPRPPFRRRHGRMSAALLVLALAVGATLGIRASLALFTDAETTAAQERAQTIFSGERVTSAFDVADRSSGSAVDGSSPFAVAGDGLTAATSAWSTAFTGTRYLEFALNDPLPDGLKVSSASFSLRFASGGAVTTACYYFEVRRISTGAVLATHGSGVAPVGCVTGTAPVAFTTSIPSVDSTARANDLRIRVYGRDSGSNGMIVDRAVVSGTTPNASFTLYPVLLVDAADTTALPIPWDLSGP
jgi:hypothetical protein